MKKKLLVVTDYFLPAIEAGGPVKSLAELSKFLDEHFDLEMMTGDRDLNSRSSYKKSSINMVKRQFGFKIEYVNKYNVFHIFRWLIINRFEKYYLNSFFSRFTLWVFLFLSTFIKGKSIGVVLAPRGELSTNLLKIKPTQKGLYIKFLTFFIKRLNVVFHATSPDEADDILRYFPESRVFIAPNFVSSINSRVDRRTILTKEEFSYVYMSRILRNKGLLHALKAFLNSNKKVNFDIYGPIEDHKYWRECHELIAKLNVKGSTVVYKGPIEPSLVPSVLSRYHFFILPTESENFGHAIVEALQSGLIPIIGANTPWSDVEKCGGIVCEFNDIEALSDGINNLADLDIETYFSMSSNIQDYIDKKLDANALGASYLTFFDN